MLKLFSNNYQIIDNDTIKVSLSTSVNETYLFDLKDIKETNIIIDIDTYVEITLLNVDSLNGKNITFNLNQGSSLNCNLASFEVSD